ncbi:MAG: WYL domain-containing protein [Betaproteobacteria bacterium]|nr:WYL domain-containing protein [Betaproteobacteria bacterium]
MAQTERLFKIRHWLDAGSCLTPAFLMRELQVSRSTLNRDVALMRDRLNAPLVFDREQGGWRLEPGAALPGAQYQLPGMYFSAEEMLALLTMQQLLDNLGAGDLLAGHLKLLRRRLEKALDVGVRASEEAARRIRVATLAARPMNVPHFQAIGTALLRRQRAVLRYRSRSRDEASEREVSPQRLIHYRDNWYLDAWCHLRGALRSFSVDAVTQVQVIERRALDVPERELDEALGAGYGIFGGREVQWATLRFSPERARWVAAERWHPQQHGRWDAEGRWLLSVPYSDPRELVMDILRHVPEVEVLGPDELEAEVLNRLRNGLRLMEGLDE